MIYFPPYIITQSGIYCYCNFLFHLPGEEKRKGQSVEVQGSQQRLFYSPDVLVLCNVEVCVSVGGVCVCVYACSCV